MASHSSIHAWEIPWTEEPGGLQYMDSQKSQTQLSLVTNNNDKKFREYGLIYINTIFSKTTGQNQGIPLINAVQLKLSGKLTP